MPRKSHSTWSSELISRTSSFVDAFVLFDKVVVPERYSKEPNIKKLDPYDEIFEYIESSSLMHSDDLVKGITKDLSLNCTNFEELEKDNYKWFSQHSGYVCRDDFDDVMKDSSISMADLRLWQLSLVNEIADKTGSTSILPLSLQGIDFEESKARNLPFFINKLSELDQHYQEAIKCVSASVGDSFTDYISNVPPFFSLMIDQALSNEHAFEVLVQLRRDFSQFRNIGIEYQNSIVNATSLRDRKEIINEWNRSWNLLVKGDFKKPQFLSKKVSSADVSKVVLKPETAGFSTIIQMFLDYREECKSYNRFKIYSELYSELDGISGSREKLKTKFSIDLVNELQL
jgi:hypothetical protein